MLQNSKKSYYNILVKLHDLVCRPRRGEAEILIKIQQTHPHIYDLPYILPQIKPTQKGPKQWPFPNISVITILSKCFTRATFDSYAADFLNNRTLKIFCFTRCCA